MVLDRSLGNPANWQGRLDEELGDCLFVNMCEDFDDEVYVGRQINELQNQLALRGVEPSQGIYFSPCTIDPCDFWAKEKDLLRHQLIKAV